MYPQEISHDIKCEGAEKQDRSSVPLVLRTIAKEDVHSKVRRELGTLNGWKKHKADNQKSADDHRKVHMNEDAQKGWLQKEQWTECD